MDDKKAKVLIAEDLRSSRLIIERLLSKWGYDPVACENGLEARDALAKPDGPRIAILDWIMPEMTGPEVCGWIAREMDAFVYTIILTSKAEREDLIEGLTAGAHAFITKPAPPGRATDLDSGGRTDCGIRVGAGAEKRGIAALRHADGGAGGRAGETVGSRGPHGHPGNHERRGRP